MKYKVFSLVSVLMAVMLVAACAPQSEKTADPVTVEALGSLSQTLRDTGATIESNETVKQDFFTVEGRILKVNGVDVQAFEYKSAEAMEAEAALISADGSSVDTSRIMWTATPHFFKSGSVLVLYVGDDAATLSLLRSVLDDQFAGR